ncbi:MAG: ABC transporter ATP-binding protein, partial [Campylobacterota bacterium]|nr:ABC transporter ATP-binding protein [Campylobacterota bacterium]
KRVILKEISLEIPSHVSILGANGSGKSTLAKAISSLLSYEGNITIDGTNTQELSLKERAKLISYIPAKLQMSDPYVTVEEFVLQGRFPYKKSFLDYSQKDKKIAKNTLEFLHIAHLATNTITSLSSGEQQLTLIAQALAQQSQIIIFDEPTANLDPHNSKIIAEHIKGLKEYHQVILITHDLHLACFVDSPIVFIKDKGAASYGKEFFEDEHLEKLYGVAFNALAVRYA